MPAVIAFQRQQSGEVDLKFGEEADVLEGVPDVEVIRNIKRYALTSDDYVLEQNEWYMEQQQGKQWPDWFEVDTKSINLGNESMAVEKSHLPDPEGSYNQGWFSGCNC